MKFRRQAREPLAINLTPLIDVVFLLLIFFMVSTTFQRETRLLVDLPEADGAPAPETQNEVEILIDEAGYYRVDGQALVDRQLRTLQAALFAATDGDTSRILLISADAQASHESVVRAMDAAGQMGFSRLTVATMASEPGGPDR